MDSKKLIKYSKYLSRHLRHDPGRLGLLLDSAGWCSVADLLEACGRNHMPLSRAELETIVAENDKQRFAFSEDGTRIRANQGHTVDVDLELDRISPPAVLYHGTGTGSASAILASGLQKMKRHHVHLSADVETATRVGARHGRPVVFAIDAEGMQQAGYAFYRSANGVYLTEDVPAKFIEVL